MSENSAIEKLSTKPNSCGCGNRCSVEFVLSNEKFSTTSLQVAAGVICGQRRNFSGNLDELLLYAQTCDVIELEDQKEALYLFSGCPRIIEYAEKFADWENAVEDVKRELFL